MMSQCFEHRSSNELFPYAYETRLYDWKNLWMIIRRGVLKCICKQVLKNILFCLSFWGCICGTSIISRRKTLYISENKYCIETLTFDSGNPWHTRTGTTYRSPCSPGTDHSTDLPSLQSPRHRGWVLINARGRTDRRFVLKKSLLPLCYK